MADGLIQKTEDRGQRTDVCVPLRGTFIKGATTPRQHFCFLSSVICLLSSVFCPLNAEELPDPTRLPAIIATPVATIGLAADSAPTGLRSIIISKTRRAAIIDGETVELGGKHGDARLIEVNEGGVVLNSVQGRQVLTLFPDVNLVRKKEVKIKSQPAANKVRTGKQKARPVARDEKLLSGHPKEKE